MRNITVLLFARFFALVVGLIGKHKESSPSPSFRWLLDKDNTKPSPYTLREYLRTSERDTGRNGFEGQSSSSQDVTNGRVPAPVQWQDNCETANGNHDYPSTKMREEEINQTPKSKPEVIHGIQIGGPDARKRARGPIKSDNPRYGMHTPVIGFFGWYPRPSRPSPKSQA